LFKYSIKLQTRLIKTLRVLAKRKTSGIEGRYGVESTLLAPKSRAILHVIFNGK
jgi:hypothetical protein